MTLSFSRRSFLTRGAVLATAAGAAACSDSGAPAVAAQFAYGVASGDPLSDRVILWTHARPVNGSDTVPLRWQVSTDTSFGSPVSSGRTEASPSTGYTVKVDATGLAAGASYFFRFLDDAGNASPVGTTRTLPASGATSVKFAVFSCSLYSAGFFNAYADAARSDVQYALHLGDYLYEYGSDPAKFGNASATTLGRVVAPANDIVTLDDYRTRYAQYRSDPDLQAAHAKMPWITIWDDHEFANNAYVNGAENHNSATQGDWVTRKLNAARAYHEWMPIRTPDAVNPLKIFRRFDFANLLTLHMIDTRIEGRDRQYDNYGDADGGMARYLTGITPVTGGYFPDQSRQMMSAEQQSWLISGISGSAATWQVVGNQDIMGRMWFPYSVVAAQAVASANPSQSNLAAVGTAIQDFLTAKATRAASAPLTPTQTALLDKTQNPRLPYNLDSWDGYPANRDAILKAVANANRRLVVLSGDSHNGWFNNLTTLAGAKVGVEFATSSVTAPGFESVGLGSLGSSIDGSVLSGQLGAAAIGAGLGLIDDVNYADTSKRGYLKLTVRADSVVGEYVYVSTITSRTFTSSVGRTITVASGNGAVTYA